MGRDSFIVHRSYFDAVDILPDDEQLELYKEIMHYGFDGHYKEDISTHARAMLMLITPNIDASNKRYDAKKENGSKGGRPKKTEEWHEKQKSNCIRLMSVLMSVWRRT